MNKKLTTTLKQNHALMDFVKICKQYSTVYGKIAGIFRHANVTNAFYDYFENYLKEKKLLETFKKEVKRQRRQTRKTNLNVGDFINLNLLWEETTQGRHFWSEEDYKWRVHVTNIIKQGLK